MNIKKISVWLGQLKSDGWSVERDFGDDREVLRIDLDIDASPQEVREAVVSEAWYSGIEIEADDVVLDPETNPTHASWDAPEDEWQAELKEWLDEN